ncbi:MAG: indole-3-glycerol phosphate synthase TrpC, partial [Clostridiales bacterium]|nr:indole-3-glycerol phosphate synthase TrpC [Clostridiales bacterium]
MIIDSIILSTKNRINAAKEIFPLSAAVEAARAAESGYDFPFERQLRRPGINFICEIKRASPSKGLISRDFPYLDVAKEYEEAGAAAVSVLTEPEFFLGSTVHLQEISSAVSIPCLRKDFIIDEYQIYESKILGAAAVLLICSLLDPETLRRYIKLCDSLGLSALVEVHNECEILSAIDAKARIIGVNNRRLEDFTVDIKNSVRLGTMIPPDIVFVAESGIASADDVQSMCAAG